MSLSKYVLIQEMLRDLQRDIEVCPVSEAVKQRQRSVLRGYRVGFWSVAERTSVKDIEQTLREELGFEGLADCASPALTKR
jgi:hypothetical protein